MPEPLPRGLVFFSPDAPPRHRRRRIAVVLLLFGAALALVWPVYPIFGGIRPFVLGLPLSFAWVVCWVVVVFAAFAWLYHSEGSPPAGEAARSSTPGARP